eukprot:maker-scaffold2031_size22261-snap-gene-0.1 protein:Tk09592 transcript:maker-scaffold2031_size22261-snap-gene-0.1-mRNA-1 annotation:"PREDICTED: cubilin"
MNSFLWIVCLVSTLVASARGAHLFSPNHRLLTPVDLMSTLPPPTPIVPGIVAECDGTTVQVESLENDKCYELSSPNYANPPYPSGVTGSPYQCRYSIKHPTQVASAQVTILTSEFAIQPSNGCTKDFLRLSGISGGNTEGTLTSSNSALWHPKRRTSARCQFGHPSHRPLPNGL